MQLRHDSSLAFRRRKSSELTVSLQQLLLRLHFADFLVRSHVRTFTEAHGAVATLVRALLHVHDTNVLLQRVAAREVLTTQRANPVGHAILKNEIRQLQVLLVGRIDQDLSVVVIRGFAIEGDVRSGRGWNRKHRLVEQVSFGRRKLNGVVFTSRGRSCHRIRWIFFQFLQKYTIR